MSFLARDSLFRVPVVGWILRNTYVFPISREAASSSSIKEAVRQSALANHCAWHMDVRLADQEGL